MEITFWKLDYEPHPSRYVSIQQALDAGLITEFWAKEAVRYPWSWVPMTSEGKRIRYMPWNGLEIEKLES